MGAGFAIFFTPKGRGQRDIPAEDWDAPDAPRWFVKGRWGPIILGSSTAIISLFIVVIDLLIKPGYWYLVTNAAILSFAVGYWYFFVWSRTPKSYKPLALHVKAQTHGRDDDNNAWRQCSLCPHYQRFEEHRHREDGYLEYNAVEFSDSSFGRTMDVVFGGFDDSEERYRFQESAAPVQIGGPGDVPMDELHKRAGTQARERGEVSSAVDSGVV